MEIAGWSGTRRSESGATAGQTTAGRPKQRAQDPRPSGALTGSRVLLAELLELLRGAAARRGSVVLRAVLGRRRGSAAATAAGRRSRGCGRASGVAGGRLAGVRPLAARTRPEVRRAGEGSELWHGARAARVTTPVVTGARDDDADHQAGDDLRNAQHDQAAHVDQVRRTSDGSRRPS